MASGTCAQVVAPVWILPPPRVLPAFDSLWPDKLLMAFVTNLSYRTRPGKTVLGYFVLRMAPLAWDGDAADWRYRRSAAHNKLSAGTGPSRAVLTHDRRGKLR